jgi:hypothetical protein
MNAVDQEMSVVEETEERRGGGHWRVVPVRGRWAHWPASSRHRNSGHRLQEEGGHGVTDCDSDPGRRVRPGWKRKFEELHCLCRIVEAAGAVEATGAAVQRYFDQIRQVDMVVFLVVTLLKWVSIQA